MYAPTIPPMPSLSPLSPALISLSGPDWLFANPWQLAVLLAGAFAILRLAARRFESRRMLATSWASLGLLVLVLAAAQLVETTTEKLVRQTKELVAACVGPKMETFDRLLAPEVRVSVGNRSRVILTGDKALREQVRQGVIRKVECSGGEVVSSQKETVKIAFSVTVGTERWGTPGMTSWEIAWRETPAGWHVVELRLVNMPGGPGMLDSIPSR